MSMNLRKGEWINLSKEAPSLKKVGIGLGWDIKHKFTPYEFELDVSVFMLGGNGKIPHEQYFVFYNNLESLDGSVRFLEDGKLGDSSGESETFEIDLGQVNPVVQEIVFVITIYDVEGRNSNFGQIQNLLLKIDDNDTKEQVTQYELDEIFSTETAIEFGKLYKQDEEWIFQAVGQGYNSELVSFVEKYAS